MDKKEYTKEVAAAMNNGTRFGMAVATLMVGGITLVLGGVLFEHFIHDTKHFNRDHPGWCDGWNELKEEHMKNGQTSQS